MYFILGCFVIVWFWWCMHGFVCHEGQTSDVDPATFGESSGQTVDIFSPAAQGQGDLQTACSFVVVFVIIVSIYYLAIVFICHFCSFLILKKMYL